MTRILVTNDDGVYSEGLRLLARALEPLGEVWIVAPDREQSATSHSLTLTRPLRTVPVTTVPWPGSVNTRSIGNRKQPSIPDRR